MLRAAALLSVLALAAEAHADDLRVEVDARAGCPDASWFRERLAQRGFRGSVRASLGAEAEGYAGEVEALGVDGSGVKRRLTGADCVTVAEGLLVVAEVHLAGLPRAPRDARGPAAAVVLARPARPAPPVRFAIGASGTVDTSVSGEAAFGGGITAWAWLGATRMRGVALSVIYGRASVVEIVPITYQHVRARLDAIPFDLPLGDSTTLGLALFLSGGALHVKADVDSSTPGTRSLWLTGAGLRLRQALGPLFLEAAVDGTLAITRRSFEVKGVDGPLFSLPLGGVAAALSVGVPIPP